jgi:phenylalanyl-tRNA synthetase beta chain
MNILVPHSWLKDYLQTNLPPEKLADLLSLHAFSVEKILPQEAQEDKDFVYEVEITPNRGDALSIMGIAREFKAILPAKGHPVSWKNTSVLPKNPSIPEADLLNLTVEITDPTLVPRFCAVVLDKVHIEDSPRPMRDRLEKVGIRPINNVVDVTNYLMVDWGQPMHAFDYDKILEAKMVVRESLEGEKIVTLDGVERTLPAGVIVIEDGSGRLIDLCGIMGAQNSEVDEKTKRVLLFVQVYDPVRIRKASMALGHRTDAALRFEKGIDYLGVVPSLWYAVDLLEKNAQAVLASNLIDIENYTYTQKKVFVDYAKISDVAGVEVTPQEVKSTLMGLGFEFSTEGGRDFVLVPSWRAGDIEIPEDLAEEVIRILGYYSLPNKLLTGEIPLKIEDPTFYWEDLVKDFLKYQGFFECYTASATSKELAGENALQLKNSLNEDFRYFRKSLVPQLLDVLSSNKGYSDEIKLFELARIYNLTEENKKEGQLPSQPFMLSLVTKGVDYLRFKGVIEALLEEMGIKGFQFEITSHEKGVLSVEIPFAMLAEKATKLRTYTPLTKFNSIKEDLTIKVEKDSSYEKIVNVVKEVDPRVISVEFADIYEDKLTLSLEFLDTGKQITSEDVAPIREKILKAVK